jgi:bcr-type benzoyl-CoA reductase subunit C
VRSATEYALKGTFDILDAALFPPICDSAKLVGSSWRLNFSDRFLVEMVNLPERLDSGASVSYLAAELRRIGAVLSERLGDVISDDALRAAIAACNRVRRLQEGFYRWRESPAGARASLTDVCTIIKAGTVMDAGEYAVLLEEFLASAGTSQRNPPPTIPVVITGLACQLPHVNLLEVFESSGLRVVNDDLFFGMRACGQIAAEGDPYMNLAQGFADSAPLATRYHSRKKRHELVLDQVRSGRAKGVVSLIPKFCEPEWFDLRYLRQELGQRSIQHISIDFEEDPGMIGAVQTRLEAFAETLS